MSLYRRNPRRDANEAAIVRALDQAGVRSWPLSGAGLPDRLALWRGRWHLLEIKTATGRLTSPQRQFCAHATAGGAPVVILRSVADVAEWLAGERVA